MVSSTFAHEVQVLSPRGGPLAILNIFDGVPLHDPQGIAVDGNELFIADGGNGRVLKFSNVRGNFVPTLSTDVKMELPQGLAIDDTLLFVVCGRMNKVYVLDKKTLKRLFYFGSDKGDASDKGAGAVGYLADPTDVAVYTPPDSAQVGVFGGRTRKLLYVTDTEVCTSGPIPLPFGLQRISPPRPNCQPPLVGHLLPLTSGNAVLAPLGAVGSSSCLLHGWGLRRLDRPYRPPAGGIC